MLYKKPKKLGRGAEGTVYKIGDNLVKKVWYDTAWCDYGLYSIVRRIKNVEKKVKTLPKKVRKFVSVPEFAGYEKKGAQIITYHEYIKNEKIDLSKFYSSKLYEVLDDNFRDLQMNSNTFYNNGKYYLLDVGIR